MPITSHKILEGHRCRRAKGHPSAQQPTNSTAAGIPNEPERHDNPNEPERGEIRTNPTFRGDILPTNRAQWKSEPERGGRRESTDEPDGGRRPAARAPK
jgi:hypothetical protein